MLPFAINYTFLIFLTTLAFSNNFILFFISWVGLNVSLYGIILKGFNSYNIEIVLKYFLAGALMTSLLLLGIAIHYLEFFTFNSDVASYIFLNNSNFSEQLSDIAEIPVLQKIFFYLLISIFLFKLGSFPFHFYIGDMYEALDFKKTMYLYTIPLKLVVFLTMLKYISSYWYLGLSVSNLIIFAGIGSIVVSAFTALGQTKLKKFWAYSYLNSLGFSLLAVASGMLSNLGELTFFAAKTYFIFYLITWCGIFEMFTGFRSKYRLKMRELYYVTDLFFIQRQQYSFRINNNTYYNSLPQSVGNPFAAYCQFAFLVYMLSLMGLPPTFGFFTKMIVYLDLINNRNTVLYFVLILFFTPVMGFAYIKLVIYTLIPTTTIDYSKFVEKGMLHTLDTILGKNSTNIDKTFGDWLNSKKVNGWQYQYTKSSKVLYLNFYDYAIFLIVLPAVLLFLQCVSLVKIIELYELFIVDRSPFYLKNSKTRAIDNFGEYLFRVRGSMPVSNRIVISDTLIVSAPKPTRVHEITSLGRYKSLSTLKRLFISSIRKNFSMFL